jgi:hypothetical protein
MKKYNAANGFMRCINILLVILMPTIDLHSSVPIEVWPSEIYFNYEEGNTNDAIAVSTYGTEIYSAEWADNDQITPPAYIKDQINRKIWVRFSSNYTGLTHLILKLTINSGDGIGEICNQFIANYTIDDYITLDLTGALPSTIGTKFFTWKWEIYGIPENSANYCAEWKTTYTDHTYYTLFETPTAPMEIPWVEALDIACNWADDQNLDTDILFELTNHLYNSGYTYESGWNYTSNNLFNLSDLFLDIAAQNDIYMDCRDFSNFLLVLSNSLGLNVQYNKIGNYSFFYYNYLLPAGFSSSVYNQTWAFHQIAWYNSSVADASTCLDFDNLPMATPNQWKLCTGDVSLNEYLDKLTEYSNVESINIDICTVY